jgi:N,N'-diacetylchitobiose phosphorylase
MNYYNALCPYYQNDNIEIREAEPYSYCQFIMGKEHTAFGRARHPFMTGTGGWAYFSATRYILGIRPGFDELCIDPCIPADWKEFKIHREWRGAMYHITVRNPEGVMKGVKQVLLNQQPVNRIPAQPSGSECELLVIMGNQEELR